MRSQNYFGKIIFLFIATFAGMIVIWYAMIRQESSDWISAQVVHQASPYFISEDDEGLIVNNVLLDYEFRLPSGFKTVGARNLSFLMAEPGEKKCEIKHYYLNADKGKNLSIGAGRAVVSLNSLKLVFELKGTESEKAFCAGYLNEIETSLTAD